MHFCSIGCRNEKPRSKTWYNGGPLKNCLFAVRWEGSTAVNNHSYLPCKPESWCASVRCLSFSYLRACVCVGVRVRASPAVTHKENNCAFNTVVQKDDLRLVLKFCTYAPLATIQALTLVVIPGPSGLQSHLAHAVHTVTALRSTASCKRTAKRKKEKKTNPGRRQNPEAGKMPSGTDSRCQTKSIQKAILKFIEPVIKRESLLPNQHPWRNIGIISCFIFTRCQTTNCGLLMQKEKSQRHSFLLRVLFCRHLDTSVHL